MDNMEKMVQQILAQTNANADADRKERKAEQEDLLTKMKDRKADQEDLLARMDAMFEAHQKRRMATKKVEPDPCMMQSAEEHQDVPNKDVAVMPVGEPRKRHRVRKSTAE
jgi:NAD(P)H-dependent flavin oxidoreductase YrpB (nitropropane dioxygenase family)